MCCKGSLSARTKIDTNMLHTRWTLLEMRKDALQGDLPAPDEACARHHCLYEGVEAPDLATIKEFFFHFYIATSYGRIVAKPTVDSINTNAEWLLKEVGHEKMSKGVVATRPRCSVIAL